MSIGNEKIRAPRNRTLTLTPDEQIKFAERIAPLPQKQLSVDVCCNKVFCTDVMQLVGKLPENFVDLLILDPPYNLAKDFHGMKFARTSSADYMNYLESWLPLLLPLLKPTASVYLCGDWACSAAGFMVLDKYLTVRNRIVWQREKGRGAKSNWKNCSEDIWFATVSDNYTFNVDAVKQKRRVIAPYRSNGQPRDWEDSPEGKFRLTCPSNFWDDISVPYWSMPENTDHPTQKPEKLLAKLILASSNPGDVVFDPFSGSGSTAVTAYKLQRKFVAVDMNKEYCTWAMARLARAEKDKHIQGYEDGVFYERNTLKHSKNKTLDSR